MTRKECIEASKKKWESKKAVWKGDITSSPDNDREMLYWLGKENSEILEIIDYRSFYKQVIDGTFSNKFTPMTELAKYKYLIDIRGWSWTDRMKILLQLGRVVLKVDSIYKEWYTDMLTPMKHYVPIKADLSDMIEKIEWLENHEDVYEDIVNNAKNFCNDYFTEDAFLRYTRDVTLKYSVTDSEIA